MRVLFVFFLATMAAVWSTSGGTEKASAIHGGSGASFYLPAREDMCISANGPVSVFFIGENGEFIGARAFSSEKALRLKFADGSRWGKVSVMAGSSADVWELGKGAAGC